MASRGGYVNGRYVKDASAKPKGPFGGGGKGGGKGDAGGGGDGFVAYERKPGDEDVTLERKFDVDIMQPGEKRIGYLFNMKPLHHYDEGGRKLTGLVLYFLQRDGRNFRSTFLYRPYFYVQCNERENLYSMRDILQQRFENEGCHAEMVERNDLDMEDHVVGRKRKMIKLSFNNSDGQGKAKSNLYKEMTRRTGLKDSFSFEGPDKKTDGGAMDSVENIYEFDVDYVNRVCIDKHINCGRWFTVERNIMATSVDNIWDTQCTVTAMPEMLVKPGLRVFAWDIECTKEPLKFPDSAHDRITLISIMVDGSGFLIVNRAEVSADIEPLEYTPKPEYEGLFDTFNEPDEAALLRRFFSLIRETNPHITVTFNGDFFDMPFVTQRAKANGLDWTEENGIAKLATGGDYFTGKWLVHLDCFAWVQRDSYLPCGARGLKAVTRYKLKYDPVELDPEDMTPFAKERPQELAAYSVSDAVATYYLYQKYIHDFIFALASIIPYNPDDVLRKGSGTLCESLLMNQAFKAEVVFPNKHHDPPLEFHEGTNRLIEQSTYEGARVECMRVGIYRADIKETFQLEPSAFQVLLNDAKKTVDFFLEIEEKVKLEDVANYQEILDKLESDLKNLCDPDKVAAQLGREELARQTSPTKAGGESQQQKNEYNLKLVEYEVIEGKGGVRSGGKKVKKSSYRVIREDFPLIYHLDVGAMYPNIILSNRLQPSAIVTKEFCNACSYNDPSNNCKRDMDWKWRGELYMATRADVRSIMNEMANEKRRYNHKDRDTGEVTRVKWSDLREVEQTAEITKAVRDFSQKAYKRMKSSIYEDKTDTVCQRENSFYVDTVRDFRDRRYVYKGLTKEWNKKLEKALEAGDPVKKVEANDMVLLYDSLQLAHKCILNSFYGYVMRKGARWHSMKMAGIVTYTGSNLIREAREFCEQVGLPIELDTDGIWCMLPKSFPDTYKFFLKNGKDIKMPYPNCVLNYRVHQKYTNHQYQELGPDGKWFTRDENSIFFEIDGPYQAMLLPASTEEDKFLKKRYAVYNADGSLAELKGFEVKRRGELRLIQVFQTEVFPAFLLGSSKEEVYQIVGEMANRWLDVIESRGKTMSDDEVIYFFSEAKSMSKSVEASGTYKSVQITCCRRLADFLGVPEMLKSEGISCHMFIANKPRGASVTDRAVPVKIFGTELEKKQYWLRLWLGDSGLKDFDMRTIIDWEYYKDRLCAVFQKLICITASYQNIANPCPRVPVPEWLRKRLAEKNDKFQQRSLGSWLKTGDAAAQDAKRKLGDLEDLAGNARPGANGAGEKDLPLVEFGAGPKRWLEAQRMQWQASPMHAGTALRGGWRTSLFDDTAAWASVSADALAGTWHVVAVEPSRAVRDATSLRVGDTVDATVDDDDDEEMRESERAPETQRGVVSAFLGGLVRVVLESGEERLLRRGAVRPAKEEGLFSLWVATGQGLSVHRCEVLAKRKVVLALASDFSPESTRSEVRPGDLVKGLRVWPRVPSEKRVGPGIVTSAAPEIGLCGVTWANDIAEVSFAGDLERQCGTVSRVLRDAPRNMQHGCLVELEIEEGEFQRQRGEGALGDRDSAWPRVDSIYEAEQPLKFDVICRLGASVKLASPEKVEEAKGRGHLRFAMADLTQMPSKDYLLGLTAGRNVYLHLCFDAARPSHAFCGIFAPALAEAWACFGGLDPKEAGARRPELEQLLAEQLGGACPDGVVASPIIRAEVTFVNGRSLNAISQWVDQKLQELRRRDGGSICVLSSQMSTAEMRGLAPSFWVDQRHLRHLTALREMPCCRAPFPETETHFPALDWPRWISHRFARKMPQLFNWWRERLALCRASGLPICNAPELVMAVVPAALDALYARGLQRDGQLRWSSPTSKPDLGETSLALVDAQETSTETVGWVLQGKDLAAGRGGGQINNPGIYRSVCMEVNLRTKLCICALQHARHLSDMEGGELSRKMIRKVQGAGEGGTKNTDHTSEVSVTSFESLVTMVQEIAAVRNAKEAEIVALRQGWAGQSAEAKAAMKEAGIHLNVATENDDDFVEAVAKAGLDDARLRAKLEELRTEHAAQSQLLDGLYGWLASPASLLHDPALVRKLHTYMDKVLQLFVSVLKKNGCAIIFASYNKVLFATGKLSVLPDISVFWQALVTNVQSVRALEPLALGDVACLSELFYGVLWLDPANWAVVPIDMGTGAAEWKVRSNWQMADFLPPAVRPSLKLYAGDLLLGPQKELGMKHNQSEVALPGADAEEDAPMDMDAAQGACAEADDEGAGEEGEADEAMAPADEAAAEGDSAAADAVAAAVAAKEKEKDADPATKSAKALEELRAFVQGDFFNDLRRRVLGYIDDIQVQQQREVPGNLAAEAARLNELAADLEGASDTDNSDVDEDGPAAEARRVEQLRRHVEKKWSFPNVAGRRAAPGSVEFEFMRALVQILQLEDSLTDEIIALRDKMCQKMKVSQFGTGIAFDNPCFPLVLRDATCQWCCVASHVDVTSHAIKGPGLWVCESCGLLYDKDAMQARLVELLESVVQAWQSQEVTCKKCRKLRTSHLQVFCDCYGRFQVRFDASDVWLVLRMLRSLVAPHDLPWLGEVLELYERIPL